MEKSAYLDAMGITRWNQKGSGVQAYVILVDKVSEELESHPIIMTVLSLVECPFTHCSFKISPDQASKVIWDMRRVKIPRANPILSSPPLNELEQLSKSKRELWNMIVAQQEATG
ncbi:DNA polymerase III subunit psi [uncultured Shewanella sp.]|uniref:DNA polymerase III subunit psi n=1 Tax=Shewanella atlantica TaxID=271099 RepID=UPI0026288F12|nr:DNA polymerase III subunit psi [uncultured Shewanella sp.]